MTSASLTVMDVGHGNCTFIHSDNNFILVDAATGSFIQDSVKERNITVIDSVVISHADADHIGGLIGLLLDESILIRTVYINQDAARKTKTFDDLIAALQFARTSDRNTRIVPSIDKDTEDLVFSDFTLEILSPCPIKLLKGVGSKDLEGRKIDANAMSVVLRLIHEEEKIALITGDMNDDSLKFIKDEGDSIKAKILIFPHHGGLPGGKDPEQFSKELCNLVEPEVVIFSNARIRHDNPKKEIIDGIIVSDFSPVLACTQLSVGCYQEEDELCSEHLSSVFPSKGRDLKHSCAGSINFYLKGEETDFIEPLSRHETYIQKFENRKCKELCK